MTLMFGNVPVPYTASWSGEDTMHIAPCRFAGRLAVCQPCRPGDGRLRFGKPHMVRQREVIARGLCDLCARTLAGRTKVSLSHAAIRATAADGPAVLQVEPMLHRECAHLSVKFCPSLQRDIATGRVEIRWVTRYRVQVAVLTPDAVEEFCGVRQVGIAGHAKIELQRWVNETPRWLGAAS